MIKLKNLITEIKFTNPDFEFEWEEAERYPDIFPDKSTWFNAVKDGTIMNVNCYMNINNTIKDAICAFETLFKNEVLATEIYYEFNKGDFSDKFVIDGEEVKFGLERVNI